jgi:predicted Zn-dependent protease
MLDTEGFAEFRKALGALRDGHPDVALPHMQRAVELEPENPFYKSYLGVAIARAEQRWADAEDLCDSAVRRKRDQPQLYLNLAEVYAAAGRRQDAVETLLMGARYAQRDSRIQRTLNELSLRRRPVIPFLRRENLINRQLGQIRHRTRRRRVVAKEATT